MPSPVMTLRIEPNLLRALKERARREGRSVSAEVIQLIRKEIEAPKAPSTPPRRTAGMFAQFESVEIEDVRRLRRSVTRRVRRGMGL
jgi:hypothetical protein